MRRTRLPPSRRPRRPPRRRPRRQRRSGRRRDTIANFDAVARYGVKAEGNAVGPSAEVLAELAGLIEAGELEIPIAANKMTIAQTILGALRTDLARARSIRQYTSSATTSTSSGTSANSRPEGSLPELASAAASRWFGIRRPSFVPARGSTPATAERAPHRDFLRYENVSSIDTKRLPFSRAVAAARLPGRTWPPVRGLARPAAGIMTKPELLVEAPGLSAYRGAIQRDCA